MSANYHDELTEEFAKGIRESCQKLATKFKKLYNFTESYKNWIELLKSKINQLNQKIDNWIDRFETAKTELINKNLEIIDTLKDQESKENINKLFFHILEASAEKERQKYYNFLLNSEL